LSPSDPCPDSDCINNKTELTGATACQVVQGSIRVLAHDVDTLDYLTAVLRDELEEGINAELVWEAWRKDLPDVAFLCYIGDTDANPAENIIVGAPAVVERGDDDENGGALLLLIGVGVPVATALALLAFLVVRKKRSTMTGSAFHMMKSDFILSGTGDPPGSFHEGLYHYMRNGTRYLSTNCEGCLETRRNSFFTDNNLGTILEDEEYEETILVSANSKDLGGIAATMDVHRCSSTLCNRCNPRVFRGTTFLPSDKCLGNHGLYTVPEHVEV
jgi:hypothetical protein